MGRQSQTRSAYLETSFVSYLVARPSRDLLISARQQATVEWWSSAASSWETFVSVLVLREASQGDEEAVESRLAAIRGIPILSVDSEATRLAKALVAHRAVPRRSAEDAFHIATATRHGVDCLLTWNFRHIANPFLWHKIESVCEDLGYAMPAICTPEQLLAQEFSEDE